MSGTGRVPCTSFYTAVHVLLIHWDTRNDELQSKDEGRQNEKDESYAQLTKLQNTLQSESKYNYHVEVYGIKARNPYRGLNVKLLEFLENDVNGSLLIIYYGGHAKIDTDRNLIWLRHDPARQSNSTNPQLKWSSLQQLLLSGCKSHVLLWLDCCNAAASIEDASSASAVEVTCSTGFENLAPLQSANSFTVHLILTLEDLLVRRTPVLAAILCKKVAARLKARWLGRDANERRVTPHHFILDDNISSDKIVITRFESSTPSVESTEGISQDHFSPEDQLPVEAANPPEILVRQATLNALQRPLPSLFASSNFEPDRNVTDGSSSSYQSESRPASPTSSTGSQDSSTSKGQRRTRRSRQNITIPGVTASTDGETKLKSFIFNLTRKKTIDYPPIDDGEIRLLHIHQGSPDDIIKCTFSTRPLFDTDENASDFHAISYVWESASEDQEIQIWRNYDSVRSLADFRTAGDPFQSVRVRRSLYGALRRLRSEVEEVIIWVDALCINQDSLEERRVLLDLLPWIFQHACHVCVWLGDDEVGSKTSSELQKFLPKVLDLAQVDRLVKTGSTAEQWKTFADLLMRRWFNRRWIIQEVVLAQQATLYYGSDFAVEWLDFCDAVGLFVVKFDEIRELFLKSPSFDHNPDAIVDIRGLPAYRLVYATQNLFCQFHFLERTSSYCADLETLVSYLPALESSAPQDAIFALLAISSDASLRRPDEASDSLNTSPPILIDYNMSPMEVFQKFTDFCIRRSKSLDIICRSWAPEVPKVPWYTTREPDSTGESRNLDADVFLRPSWIPSVSSLPFGKRGRNKYGRINGDSLVGTPDKKWYNAAKGTVGMAIFGRKESGSLDTSLALWQPVPETFDGSMTVSGFILDSIAVLGPRAPGGTILADWIEMAGWKEGDSIVPDYFWRSLVADRGPHGTPPPTWYHRACLYCLEQSGGYDVVMSRFTGERCPSIIVEFLDRVRDIIWNRKFFQTSFEEATGLYGLAPPKAEVGDSVCILNGCSVPVILRTSHKHPGTWELVGECFVYGMMDGEAITLERSRGTQEFELR